MCGPEVTDRPRGGALAALGPPSIAAGDAKLSRALRGDLAFHTPGSPGSAAATHARLTPGLACGDMADLSDLRVVIHASGDLTRRASECGLFRQFALPSAEGCDGAFVELPLESPLSLEVGGSGIIGRRVSLCSRRACGREFVVAEGIVGFNFAEQARAAL